MKRLALISSYCEIPEKVEVLKQTLVKVKELGMDSLLLSPIQLSPEIISMCDYYFQTKDNPVLDWPEFSMLHWSKFGIGDGKSVKLTVTIGDYGWAGLFQTKRLSQIAANMDYDRFYHMIYDLKFEDWVIDEILAEDKVCMMYPFRRHDLLLPVGLHFMIFDKQNMAEFESHIDRASYIASGQGPEPWLKELRDRFKYSLGDNEIRDLIEHHVEIDKINHSPTDLLRFFIVKDYHTQESIKIFFYWMEPVDIKLTVESNVFETTVSNFSIIDLAFNGHEIKPVTLEVGGKEFDITDTIAKIKHSTLEITNE